MLKNVNFIDLSVIKVVKFVNKIKLSFMDNSTLDLSWSSLDDNLGQSQTKLHCTGQLNAATSKLFKLLVMPQQLIAIIKYYN